MRYSDALLEVRARLQELVEDFWRDNELLRAINEGVTRFAQEEKWPYLYTVAENVALAAETTTLELQPGVAYERHFNMLLTFAGETLPRKPRRVHPSEGYDLRMNYAASAAEPLAYYIQNQLRQGQDEVQSLVNTGTTVGTFTLTFDGFTTGSISRGASAADIYAALVALSNIGPGDIVVWGGPLGTGTVYIRYIGTLGGIDLPLLSLGGTITSLTHTTVSNGGGPDGTYTPVIRFVPSLTRAATIEYQYIRDPVLYTGTAALLADTDHLDIPDEYAMGVCAYATAHAFLKELNFSRKADEQLALYQKAVSDATRNARKVTPDSGLVWGRQEPQWGWSDPDVEPYYSVPDLLGP